ncbi:unnamed protein product [Colias eurytheme]|nr:unnamed protein product [Colias eurytheme]
MAAEGRSERRARNSAAPALAHRNDRDDYDPHMHRELQNPTTDLESLVHILRLGLGTGILAMPQAFARAGIATGVVATVIVAVVVTHCLQVLIRAQYDVCKMRRVAMVPYPEAARIALEQGPRALRPLGRPTPAAIDFFLVTYQLGVCCCYIVFMANSCKKLFDPVFVMPVEMYMLIFLPPIIALNLIKSLKKLAPYSAVANVMAFISICIILYYLLTGQKSVQPIELWGSPATFPLFFGTIVFALTAVGVVVAVENNTKTPKSFGRPCGVLHIGMTLTTTLFLAVGYFGYIFCGSECSDAITLDLPKETLASAAVLLYALAIFISYALHCYVPVDVLWNTYLSPRLERGGCNLVLWEYCVRVGLCLLTFMLAVSVPRLGLFISLFGALCSSALGFCFPALMEASLAHARPPSPARLLLMLKDVALFVAGIVGLVAGTYTSILGIIMSFTDR